MIVYKNFLKLNLQYPTSKNIKRVIKNNLLSPVYNEIILFNIIDIKMITNSFFLKSNVEQNKNNTKEVCCPI